MFNLKCKHCAHKIAFIRPARLSGLSKNGPQITQQDKADKPRIHTLQTLSRQNHELCQEKFANVSKLSFKPASFIFTLYFSNYLVSISVRFLDQNKMKTFTCLKAPQYFLSCSPNLLLFLFPHPFAMSCGKRVRKRQAHRFSRLHVLEIKSVAL